MTLSSICIEIVDIKPRDVVVIIFTQDQTFDLTHLYPFRRSTGWEFPRCAVSVHERRDEDSPVELFVIHDKQGGSVLHTGVFIDEDVGYVRMSYDDFVRYLSTEEYFTIPLVTHNENDRRVMFMMQVT